MKYTQVEGKIWNFGSIRDYRKQVRWLTPAELQYTGGHLIPNSVMDGYGLMARLNYGLNAH